MMAGGAFDLAAEAPAPDVETGDTGHEPTGALAASGASIGRLLRDITQAVRQFKGSRRRKPLKIKSVVAAAREVRRVI